MVLVNTYLPPKYNLGRQNISENTVREGFLNIANQFWYDSKLVIARDLNARIGDLLLTFSGHPHPPRVSSDMYVCARGKWLIE